MKDCFIIYVCDFGCTCMLWQALQRAILHIFIIVLWVSFFFFGVLSYISMPLPNALIDHRISPWYARKFVYYGRQNLKIFYLVVLYPFSPSEKTVLLFIITLCRLEGL